MNSYKCKYGYCSTCTLQGCGCQCHRKGPDGLSIAVADAVATDSGTDGGGCGGD